MKNDDGHVAQAHQISQGSYSMLALSLTHTLPQHFLLCSVLHPLLPPTLFDKPMWPDNRKSTKEKSRERKNIKKN